MDKVVLLLDDRKILEDLEDSNFDSIEEVKEKLKSMGMDEEMARSFEYYHISDFMDLVNDQVLDNLTEVFFGYVNIKKVTKN